MTNKDRLIELLNTDISAALKEMEKLTRHPLHAYIDSEKYLEGEDKDPTHYIRHKGECYVLPSEYEILCSNPKDAEITEEYRESYIEEHKRKALILEENGSVMGVPYETVYFPDSDVDYGGYVQVPAANIQRIGGEEK